MEAQILQQIGFSKGEIKVYFALSELGQSTIGPLAKKSAVTAAKVYPILDKLAKKGLCSYIIKSNVKYFEAANPQKIIEYLEEKSRIIEEEKKEIKKIIPLIEQKQKLSKDLPTAQIYQNYEGLRTLYNEIIWTLKENRENFIAFTLGKEEYENKESEYFFQEYDTKRREYGIGIKLLGHTSQKAFMNNVVKGDKNIAIRYLPYRLPTGVIIFGNKVATLVWQDIPTAFVIESKQVAESYKKFFQDMWKIAKG